MKSSYQHFLNSYNSWYFGTKLNNRKGRISFHVSFPSAYPMNIHIHQLLRGPCGPKETGLEFSRSFSRSEKAKIYTQTAIHSKSGVNEVLLNFTLDEHTRPSQKSWRDSLFLFNHNSTVVQFFLSSHWSSMVNSIRYFTEVHLGDTSICNVSQSLVKSKKINGEGYLLRRVSLFEK